MCTNSADRLPPHSCSNFVSCSRSALPTPELSRTSCFACASAASADPTSAGSASCARVSAILIAASLRCCSAPARTLASSSSISFAGARGNLDAAARESRALSHCALATLCLAMSSSCCTCVFPALLSCGRLSGGSFALSASAACAPAFLAASAAAACAGVGGAGAASRGVVTRGGVLSLAGGGGPVSRSSSASKSASLSPACTASGSDDCAASLSPACAGASPVALSMAGDTTLASEASRSACDWAGVSGAWAAAGEAAAWVADASSPDGDGDDTPDAVPSVVGLSLRLQHLVATIYVAYVSFCASHSNDSPGSSTVDHIAPILRTHLSENAGDTKHRRRRAQTELRCSPSLAAASVTGAACPGTWSTPPASPKSLPRSLCVSKTFTVS